MIYGAATRNAGSAGEKLILAKVRQILVGESPWAASAEDAKAETLLDAVLAAAS